jgi:hypothetical protein
VTSTSTAGRVEQQLGRHSYASPLIGGGLNVVFVSRQLRHADSNIEIDSSAHPIGMTTTDRRGACDLTVRIPETGPAGHHNLRAVGVRPGGQTLTLVTPIMIKTEAECVSATTAKGSGTSSAGSGSDNLPFTGGEVTDLALLGGAAVVGGRVLYGMSKRHSGDIDRADR